MRGLEVLTRYSFSDALPESIRWDSATSTDAGVTWKTTWIMEFTRTRPREETQEEGIFEGLASKAQEPDPRASQIDFLLGDWVGVEEQNGEDGKITRLDLRGHFAKIVSDYLVVGRINAAAESGVTEKEISVCSFVPAKGAWEWWRLDESHVFEQLEGRPRGSELVLYQHEEGRLVRRVTLEKKSDDAFTTTIERSADDGETFSTEKTRRWRRQ